MSRTSAVASELKMADIDVHGQNLAMKVATVFIPRELSLQIYMELTGCDYSLLVIREIRCNS